MRQRSAPLRSWSSLGFDLRQENRRALECFARQCSLRQKGSFGCLSRPGVWSVELSPFHRKFIPL